MPLPKVPDSYLITQRHLIKLWAWDQSRFTDPRSIPQASRAPVSGLFRFIVRAMSDNKPENRWTQMYSAAPFASFDYVSTSVINETKSGTYFPFGVILGVPNQNLIATSGEDLWTPRGAPGLLNPVGLVRGGPDPIGAGLRPDHIMLGQLHEIYRSPRELLTPEEVLQRTCGGLYNEILVVSRPGVTIYPNFPPTAPLKILGLFWKRSGDPNVREEQEKTFTEIKKMPRRWPVIVIP